MRSTKLGGEVYILFLSFNGSVKLRAKVCTHRWNIDKSTRRVLIGCRRDWYSSVRLSRFCHSSMSAEHVGVGEADRWRIVMGTVIG